MSSSGQNTLEILTFTKNSTPDPLPKPHLILTDLHLNFTLPSPEHLELREDHELDSKTWQNLIAESELDKSLWARIIFGFIWSFAAYWQAHPLSSCILLNKSFESFPPCLLVIEVWWLPELTINTDQAHSFSVFEAFNIKLQQITPFLGQRTHTQILGKCIWSRSYFFWLFCAGACCREGRGPANVISKVVFGVYLQLCGVRLPVSVLVVLRVVTIVWIIVSPVLSSICKYQIV